jgi:hypothetical protein
MRCLWRILGPGGGDHRQDDEGTGQDRRGYVVLLCMVSVVVLAPDLNRVPGEQLLRD